MEKQYKKHFEEPLFKEACKVCTGCGRICECAEKDLAKSCKKMNEAIKKFNETCPENSKPTSGGACARVDKSGNLGGLKSKMSVMLGINGMAVLVNAFLM